MRIGIDLGGTKTEGVLMTLSGEIAHKERCPTPKSGGFTAILQNIASLALSLEELAGTNCKVGICTPGSISSRNGLLKNSNTVCLNGKAIQDDLEKLLDREIRIENDANCFALSEAMDGAGRDHEIVFGVIMGTGVGGGLVFNKQLIKGRHAIAGEWGHNVLHADGPDCYCGKKGCVETFLSGPALLNQYIKYGGENAANAIDVVKFARCKQPIATKVFQQFIENFGFAMSQVVNIVDPDVIVLGGGMSAVNELYELGFEVLSKKVFNDFYDGKVLKNKHGDSSGVRGAAWLWPAH